MKKKFIFYKKQKNTQNKSIDLIQFNEKKSFVLLYKYQKFLKLLYLHCIN